MDQPMRPDFPVLPDLPVLPVLPVVGRSRPDEHHSACPSGRRPDGAARGQRRMTTGTPRDGRAAAASEARPADMRLRLRFRRANRSRRRWQQQRHATSSSASRCRYEYGNDDGRMHQGKGSARASHPEAGPAHIRATSLPLSVPRRSLLSRSYLGWGVFPPFSSWRVFAEGAACG